MTLVSFTFVAFFAGVLAIRLLLDRPDERLARFCATSPRCPRYGGCGGTRPSG